MTYVMSDLHGHYQKYLKMLETIRFTDDDDLFILGDAVDRGPQPAELLQDVSMRTNVFPLMGNHDLTAAILLRKLNVMITNENCENQLGEEIMKHLLMWQMDGGQTTIIAINGQLVTSPDYEAERQISDIIYFATALPDGV